MKAELKKLQLNQNLSVENMQSIMHDLMDKKYTDLQIGAFLMALSMRGETSNEITGAVRTLRERAQALNTTVNAVDCCGTGGDASGTYNISTAVSLVSASCGIPIAKHGNRAASSKSGTADVLEALGVFLSDDLQVLTTALEKLNFCFLMAPHHHTAMKHLKDIRKELGFKTFFNLIGPLANPANTKLQLIGVYDKKWTLPIAETLKTLGTERAWIVHGEDGLDEISISGKTYLAILDKGKIKQDTINPGDFGLPIYSLDQLKGGDAEYNASALLNLLKGERSAYRDIVLANTAAVIAIHSGDYNLKDNVKKAAESIDNGKALKLLNDYKEFVR